MEIRCEIRLVDVKKTITRVTEAEILRDSSEDPNDASLEITDDDEENPTLRVAFAAPGGPMHLK